LKKSVKNGGTLAIANLAYRYMDSGFIDDAKKIISESKDKEEVHKNVAEATAALKDNIEKEDKREKDFIDEAEKEQNFLAEFAVKYLTPSGMIDYSGNWKSETEKHIVIMQDKDMNILGVWGNADKTKFEGRLVNSAMKVKNHRMLYSRYSNPPKELDYVEDGNGYIYFNHNDRECSMEIMNIKDGVISYHSLTRNTDPIS